MLTYLTPHQVHADHRMTRCPGARTAARKIREELTQPASGARPSRRPSRFPESSVHDRKSTDALTTSEPSRSVATTGPTECLPSPRSSLSAPRVSHSKASSAASWKRSTVDRPVGTPIVATDRTRVCWSSLGGARRNPGPTRLVRPWPQVRPAPYREPAPRAGASRPGRTPGGLPGRRRPRVPDRTRDRPSRPR